MKLRSPDQPCNFSCCLACVGVGSARGGEGSVRLFGAHVVGFFLLFFKLGLIGLAKVVLSLEAQMLENGGILAWWLCGILIRHFC